MYPRSCNCSTTFATFVQCFYNVRTGCNATAVSRPTIFRLLLTLEKTLQCSKTVFCFSYKPGQQYRSNCSHFGPLQKHDIEELQPAILHDNRKYWARHHLFATVPSACQHLVLSHQGSARHGKSGDVPAPPWCCSVYFRAFVWPSHGCRSGAPAISSDIQVYMFRKVCSAPFVCCHLTGLASGAYFEEFISATKYFCHHRGPREQMRFPNFSLSPKGKIPYSVPWQQIPKYHWREANNHGINGWAWGMHLPSVTWTSSSRKGKRAAIHVCSTTELLSTQIHLHQRSDQGARHIASLHEHASAHTLGYGHLADLLRHLGVANSSDRGCSMFNVKASVNMW